MVMLGQGCFDSLSKHKHSLNGFVGAQVGKALCLAKD